MSRAHWVTAGGIAALVAIVVMTVLFALGVGLGAASGGRVVASPRRCSDRAVLGLYAAAIVGIGFAIGGLWRTSLAGEFAARS